MFTPLLFFSYWPNLIQFTSKGRRAITRKRKLKVWSEKKTSHDIFFIRVHHLAGFIHYHLYYYSNRSLRTRAMYLVINLTIVDMFVGGFSSLYHLLLLECDIWEIHLTLGLTIIIEFLCIWFPLTSLTNIAVISLERMHATIRPFRHRLIKKWVYGVTIAGVWVSAAMVSTAILILEV